MLHRSIAWEILLRGSKSAALDSIKASGDEKSSTWSELPQDLVTEILRRLKSYQDFVCATSTCAFWRSIGTANAHTFSGGYQFPWLMLAEEGGGGGGYCNNTNLRGFYNVRKKMTCYLKLPEANGKKHCLSWHGWLVTIDSSLELNVVHPLSGVQIKLPDITNTLDLHSPGFYPIHLCYDSVVEKAVFSSSPSSDGQYTLSLILTGGRIMLWRKGDVCWRYMNELGIMITDIVFYKGQFYATSRHGTIFSWDTQGTAIQVVAKLPDENLELMNTYFIEKMYLVESSGSLLMVSRKAADFEDLKDDIEGYGTHKFQVFEVSLCKSDDTSWRQVSDLGDRALFLGFNSSFSINASDFPGCNQNCIYFTDDLDEFYSVVALGGGKDMGIYHLEDGRLERFPVQSFSHICPPIWVELTI